MLTLFVELPVKSDRIDDFLRAMEENARSSVRDEPGCLRFDVSRDREDPSKVYLYEVYVDAAALDAHRTMPHYLKWRDTVKDWYTGELTRRLADTVVPTDSEWQGGR